MVETMKRVELDVERTVELMKMMKALDNTIRRNIVEFVLNSSSVSFTDIYDHLKGRIGLDSKGTLVYHLDILLEGNILSKKLERGEGRDYSKYDITGQAEKILEELELVETIS